MATIKQVLAHKGTHVFSIGPDATVLDAALLMNEHKVGALVVIDQNRIVGIVTERDVLRRVVAKRRDPGEITVNDVMTHEVICCQIDTPIDDARALFMQKRIRHLPVVDDQRRLEGMVSIGDLNAWMLDGQEQELTFLHEYLNSRG